MFKKKMDKDSADTDKKIAELRGKSKDDDEAGPSRGLSGPITKEFLKKAAKDGVTQDFLKKEEADLASIMKMVEDEKKSAELKRAQEEVDGYDYPNQTMEEFEKNVIFKHNDNVTQWVQSFCDRRGWFVQIQESGGTVRGHHKATCTITIKDAVITCHSSKKKDSKNQAFKAMATRLGELLRKLKPQPGTDLLELRELTRKMREREESPGAARRRNRSRSIRRDRSRSAARRRTDHKEEREARRRRSSSRGSRRNRSGSRGRSKRRSRSRTKRSPSRKSRRSRSKTRRSRSKSKEVKLGKRFYD